MTRVPKDRLPQRRLVDLLRVEIDRAMRSGHVTKAVRDLVADNPNSVWSSHVMYNLGKARVDWLRARLPAPPPRREARNRTL